MRERTVGSIVRTDRALRLEQHIAGAGVLAVLLVNLHVGAEVARVLAHDLRLVDHRVEVEEDGEDDVHLEDNQPDCETREI